MRFPLYEKNPPLVVGCKERPHRLLRPKRKVTVVVMATEVLGDWVGGPVLPRIEHTIAGSQLAVRGLLEGKRCHFLAFAEGTSRGRPRNGEQFQEQNRKYEKMGLEIR